MTPTINYYEIRYKGAVNELLKTLAAQNDYYNLHKYASQAIAVDAGNLKAHYWLILATYNLGSDEMAETQLEAAEASLTEEEYYDLLKMLKEADVNPFPDAFYNQKLAK